jgi:hypothetical protein
VGTAGAVQPRAARRVPIAAEVDLSASSAHMVCAPPFHRTCHKENGHVHTIVIAHPA